MCRRGADDSLLLVVLRSSTLQELSCLLCELSKILRVVECWFVGGRANFGKQGSVAYICQSVKLPPRLGPAVATLWRQATVSKAQLCDVIENESKL